MKISKFISLFFFIFNLFFLISPLNSKELRFENLKKLNLDDLQTLTKKDLFKSEYSANEINQIISDLYQSELIYNIEYNSDQRFHIFLIDESKIINQIFFNGNIQLKDEDLINIIKTSEKSLFNKNKSLEDLKIISSLYLNQGYEDVNVTLSTETISENRINLIFNIYEGETSNIIDINFLGNKFFSNRYLTDTIKSESKSFLSFFSGGSNFDKNLFQFDRDLLINLYKDNGYFDIKINYQLNRLLNKNYELNFYIIENERAIISKVDFPNEELSEFPKVLEIFSELSDYSKNDNLYYDKEFISSFIDESNNNLEKNNINYIYFDYSIDLVNQIYVLKINKIEKEQLIVNKINIYGNSITKDETIRSKINLEPGDILNQSKLKSIISKLSSYKYINDVNISSENFEKFADISIDLEENKKLGAFYLEDLFQVIQVWAQFSQLKTITSLVLVMKLIVLLIIILKILYLELSILNIHFHLIQ
jgi:outer membrane protein insertion porin family